MTEPHLSYIGPIPKTLEYQRAKPSWWRRLPIAFLLVVVLPTLLAAVYYLLIATPRYQSEARFIVRSSNESTPNALGVALQGVGLSMAQSDAYAVHEYMTSRDAFEQLKQRHDLRRMLQGPGADALSRYPRPWEGQSDEDFYKAFQRFLVVGHDSSTGISTVRVLAFKPRDARILTESLLSGGESLINRLNERAESDNVEAALRAREDARQRLSTAQQQLTAFRTRERFIDPAVSAEEGSRLIGNLLSTLAELRAERSQLAGEAPSSPQLPSLDNRIRAYERQVESERAKIAGNSDSLAPRLSVYETLALNRELADRELTAATASLTTAEQEARRQKLYLDRIVSPSMPDAPAEPKRLLSILVVAMSALLAYGIGWFVWAGASEHGQD